ncbi:hypothetical protein [Burkholderia sp. AU28863]|uniref:hypothetical protein n=1 Tax=Burkholderia sp. AU28863 TaxID=2015352 RepID=UPI000B7A76F1|nr:hypothetical protein [Burkholderia sp. AU28863]
MKASSERARLENLLADAQRELEAAAAAADPLKMSGDRPPDEAALTRFEVASAHVKSLELAIQNLAD